MNDDSNNKIVSEEECPLQGPVSARMGCILSYAGSEKDMWINYTVLLVNLLWCCWVATTTKPTTTSPHNNNNNNKIVGCHMASLVFVVAFQLGLCLQLGCAGISIVWCAMAAWAVAIQQQQQQQGGQSTTAITTTRFWQLFPSSLTVAVILYYMVVAPVITTVAHLCALVLGYGLAVCEWHLPSYCQQQQQQQSLVDSLTRTVTATTIPITNPSGESQSLTKPRHEEDPMLMD
jgi:hypothetical protein